MVRVSVGVVVALVVVVIVVVVDLLELADVGDREVGRVEGAEVDDVALGVDDRGVLEDVGERLGAAHLGDGRGHLAGVDELLRELVGRHAVARRLLHEPGGELGLGDRELLGLGDAVEDELALERVAGLGLDLGAVVVVAVAVGEVVVDLLADDALGQRDLGRGEERLGEENVGTARERAVGETGAVALDLGKLIEIILNITTDATSP